MNAGDGTDPIQDDEILYRRIPLHWYLADVGLPAEIAFNPTKIDEEGISLTRAKYATPQDAARNPRDKKYYLAILNAGELAKEGLTVKPTPSPDNPGHCDLTDLTYSNRSSASSMELRVKLATELTREVIGPY